MKQVIVRKGTVVVEEVPAPAVEPGTVLVHVAHSCISVGTELSGIQASATPLWQKAVRNPDKVRRVLEVASTQGVDAARQLVAGATASGLATGYSAAGSVVEVGAGVDDIRVGDEVACAGAQAAHHAEFIRVPRNLTARIPTGTSLSDASTVTLGAIALQGIRRANPTLGETFVVIGLGILGQLTSQLLRAHGCRVIGTDLDSARVSLARDLGMDLGLSDEPEGNVDEVERLTGGIGADGVIITASTRSSEVVSKAFKMARRKGRVVLVGDVGLDIQRSEIYQKELDFLVSTSYGPGRYDQSYEEHGLDYPVGYVRWTENRNMQEYLRLVADGRVRVAPLVGASFSIDEAPAAFETVRRGDPRPIIVLLDYPAESRLGSRRVDNPAVLAKRDGAIGVAVVGAGGFAKGVHLPNIQALRNDLRLEAVVSRTGANAVDTARQFGARYSSTDFEEILDDDAVDLVVIATRHDKHADMVLRALHAGKHVLVEKPLAISRDELTAIQMFFADMGGSTAPVLLTGFNRRFSAYGQEAAKFVSGRTNPMMIDYRMNAGYVPMDHWVHSDEGGGRNLGEACHIYDLFTFLSDARFVDVHASSIRPATDYYAATDNFAATISFQDGSVASLTYTAMGSPAGSKERMDLYVDGRVLLLDDYKELSRAGVKKPLVSTSSSEKGQRQELEALVRTIRGSDDWPIPIWQQIQATEIAFEVQEQITGLD